jgi:hypothetical protein
MEECSTFGEIAREQRRLISMKMVWMYILIAWCGYHEDSDGNSSNGAGMNGVDMVRRVCQEIGHADMGVINGYIREIPEGNCIVDGNEATEFVEKIRGCLGELDGEKSVFAGLDFGIPMQGI